MRLHAWLGMIIVCGVLLGVRSVGAAEPLGIYEDWRDNTIRSDRWTGQLTAPTHGMRREVGEGHALHLNLRREGGTASDIGAAVVANQLIPTTAALMTRLEADVEVNALSVTGCAGNPTLTRIRPAIVSLGAFSDGTAPQPGSLIGDHFLVVQVNREAFTDDPEGVLTVQVLLFRCILSNCGNAISTNFNLNAGTVQVGEPFTLRATWDAVNHRFLAGAGNNPDVEIDYDPALNAGPPHGPITAISTQAVVANCTSGPTVDDAKVVVHEIRTNAAALVP